MLRVTMVGRSYNGPMEDFAERPFALLRVTMVGRSYDGPMEDFAERPFASLRVTMAGTVLHWSYRGFCRETLRFPFAALRAAAHSG